MRRSAALQRYSLEGPDRSDDGTVASRGPTSIPRLVSLSRGKGARMAWQIRGIPALVDLDQQSINETGDHPGAKHRRVQRHVYGTGSFRCQVPFNVDVQHFERNVRLVNDANRSDVWPELAECVRLGESTFYRVFRVEKLPKELMVRFEG